MLGTCAGCIRYLGVLLHDADRIQGSRQRGTRPRPVPGPARHLLDLNDPDVIKQARIDGIPDSWMEAARNSPVYKMAVDWKVALPLHPAVPHAAHGLVRATPVAYHGRCQRGPCGREWRHSDVSQLRIPVQYL